MQKNEENLLDKAEKAILGKNYLTLDAKKAEDLAKIEEREQALIEYWLSTESE